METESWPAHAPTLSDGEVALRSWREDDADAVYRACQDPDIQRFTNVPVPYLPEHAAFFVGPFQRDNWANRTGVGFAVTRPEADQILGACGLAGLDVAGRRSGVGYWTASWARGQGVASRALRLVGEWALTDLGLRQVYVEIEDSNTASIAAARNAGFRQPGDMKPRWEELKGQPRLFVTLVRNATSL